MTEQISEKALREARKMVIAADSRRLVARLISTKQPVSELQLYMIGVKRPDLEKIGYRVDFELCRIVPIEAPKTKKQLIEEILDVLSKYSNEARNIPKRLYLQVRHNSRLIQRMVNSA